MITIKKVNVVNILLWDRTIGAVSWDEKRSLGSFEYTSDFLQNGFDIAPLTLPRKAGIFSFPELNPKTFHGLPGLLADSLPDRYGNKLIDLWLKQNGRSPDDFTPVERLCTMGARGMGALEFKPALMNQGKALPLEVAELTALAKEILTERKKIKVKLHGDKASALNQIIRVGTSAGGNRAKAVVAWNPKTKELQSGQVEISAGFEPWILKFDGINDAALGDPQGFGRVEYTYYKMAQLAGITMNPCRLLEENNRAHFMTKRFDRDATGEKIHMQSLCAMAHYDFNATGEHSYEQAFRVIQKLNLGHETFKEMYRRMIFNIVARNQDDHTRNIAFLMDKHGHWSLAPAFDVVWSFNPAGKWTNRHQMTINGKWDDFTLNDLLSVADQFGIKGAKEMIKKVTAATTKWPSLAKKFGVESKLIKIIGKTHRLNF